MRKKNYFWKLLLKVLLVVILAFVLTIGALLIIAGVRHSSLKKEEAQYLVPPGEVVNVNGHDLNVIHRGDETKDKALVFVHSNKSIDNAVTLSPLFDELEDYEIIYVDRSGYGFSDDYDADKSIDAMLDEVRQAVQAVSERKSYIVVAEKAAGVMAIHWANRYPDEVEAIVGLHMFFPDQYTELEDDAYCNMSNKLLVTLVKCGAHRYASSIYPSNDFSLYTERQMTVRNALVSNRFYTKGMYNEDKQIVKNAKLVAAEPWPEATPMYLIYANPFMDPYLHESADMQELYNQVTEQGEEYDPVASYNDYYRTYVEDKNKRTGNITIEEISGPEKLITYNPKELAKLISHYTNSLE